MKRDLKILVAVGAVILVGAASVSAWNLVWPRTAVWFDFQRDGCKSHEMKEAFFDGMPPAIDAPVVLHGTVIDLLPKSRAQENGSAPAPTESLLGILKVEGVDRGDFSEQTVVVNLAALGCAVPLRIGKTGVLAGTVVGQSSPSFFPKLSRNVVGKAAN